MPIRCPPKDARVQVSRGSRAPSTSGAGLQGQDRRTRPPSISTLLCASLAYKTARQRYLRTTSTPTLNITASDCDPAWPSLLCSQETQETSTAIDPPLPSCESGLVTNHGSGRLLPSHIPLPSYRPPIYPVLKVRYQLQLICSIPFNLSLQLVPSNFHPIPPSAYKTWFSSNRRCQVLPRLDDDRTQLLLPTSHIDHTIASYRITRVHTKAPSILCLEYSVYKTHSVLVVSPHNSDTTPQDIISLFPPGYATLLSNNIGSQHITIPSQTKQDG